MQKNQFAILLASLRKENGLTQQEVADSLNVSNRTVSKWESGDGYPEITILPKIASLFCVTCDELLEGTLHEKSDKKGFYGRDTYLLNEKMRRNNIILSIFSYLSLVVGFFWFITVMFTYFNIFFASAIFFSCVATGFVFLILNSLRMKSYGDYTKRFTSDDTLVAKIYKVLHMYIFSFITSLMFLTFLLIPFWEESITITPKTIDLGDYFSLYIPCSFALFLILIGIYILIVKRIKKYKKMKGLK